MITRQTADAIETIKRQLRSLRAVSANVAEGVADWREAEALAAIADVIAEQVEAPEFYAQPACEDHPTLDMAA